MSFLSDRRSGIGCHRYFGAGVLSDAYFAALQIPNLFRRLLAEGALNSAFVPMWLRIEEESGGRSARRFAEEVYGTMLFTLGTGVGGGIIIGDMVLEGEHSHGAELGHAR